jgi:hypothetical protein
MPFSSLVGHGCHFLPSLLRNSEASLPLVEPRIRERVIDTGSQSSFQLNKVERFVDFTVQFTGGHAVGSAISMQAR